MARDEAERKRLAAKTNYNKYGQPMECFFFVDAMSEWTTSCTPSMLYNGRKNKDDAGAVFDDRLMAVEMTCGPVDCTIHYHSNELVKHGANYMIEVQRLAFFELQTR